MDDALDALILEEAAPSAKGGQDKPSLLSVDEARAKLSPEILKALADKFKGSLTQTRQIDERDQIF